MANSVQILDAIRSGKNRLSRKDLHVATGISWGTVYRTIDMLIADGLVAERKEGPSGRGRPNIPISLVPGAAYFLGVDIGACQTKLVLCDHAFNIAVKLCVPTPRYSGEEPFWDWLEAIIGDGLSRRSFPREKLRGVGLSVSGNVDSENSVIVSGGNFGLKWGADLPVSRLAQRCGISVRAITTSAAAVWGEYWFGEFAGCANLVTVGLGAGIGSGAVSGGQLLISQPRRPIGYIGHMLMPDNPRVCVCGYRGCLESYSGGNSLALIAAERRPTARSAAELDAAAAAGDAVAQEILLKAASYNAVGVASMIQLYSPEAVVFAGGQSREDGFLYQHTIEALLGILPHERRQTFTISLTRLGEYQSAMGAARLAYEKFL
ncbi:MAG: ROK family transcriptional regulator [Capsulimonadaceae bacterium]|nr:ROK family transcriptional regulator [Capsulimonadaceae bacterium]